MRITGLLLLAASLAATAGCGGKKGDSGGEMRVSVQDDERPVVEYMVLRQSEFADETLSNGVLSSARKTVVRWNAAGMIVRVAVKDGDRVAAGQTLAAQDKTDAETALQRARDDRARALIEMQDFLIGQGYRLADSAKVPKNTRDIAMLKSGYRAAELSCRAAERGLAATVLKAPIARVVANLAAMPHNTAAAGEEFCTILDNSRMEAEFTLMEDEMPSVSKGQAVEVSPLSDDEAVRMGSITAINPIVGQDGLVSAVATLQGAAPGWIDGMKVNVRIRKMRPGKLVVPRGAVVIRDGKHVVFTIHGGRAYWNYVSLGLENSRSYTIDSGLEEGDSVIVAGNGSLAHLSEITVGKEVAARR